MWSKVLGQMKENERYNASSLGVAGATMTAMVKRGYVIKFDGKPASYQKTVKGSQYSRIWGYIESSPKQEYYSFLKKGERYGMLCRIKGNDIYDCYDKLYSIDDITHVVERENGKPIYITL